MREIFKQFFDHDISRRDFSKKLLALGFSQIAASTLVTSVAEARDVIPREGKRITGTGAEILAEP